MGMTDTLEWGNQENPGMGPIGHPGMETLRNQNRTPWNGDTEKPEQNTLEWGH